MPSDLLPRRFQEKRLFRSRSDGDCPVSQRLGRHKKKLGMNALSAAFSYYLAAGRRVEEMEEDGRLQDVYIRTPELVLMARRWIPPHLSERLSMSASVLSRDGVMPGISIFWREMYGNCWLINGRFFPCPGF